MHPISARLIRPSLVLLLLSACSDTSQPATPDAQSIHRDAITIDAHADIELPGQPSSYVGADGLSKVSPAKMRAGGLDAVVMSIAVGPKPRTPEGYDQARRIAETELAAAQSLVDDPANNMILATGPSALRDAHAQGQQALILGMQNALILGSDSEYLDVLYKAGVRVFALTHMGHNDYADSSRPLFNAASGSREPDAEHSGLSELGVAAIRRINALGGIVDIAQLSRQAALQAIEVSTSPVIASHSTCRR